MILLASAINKRVLACLMDCRRHLVTVFLLSGILLLASCHRLPAQKQGAVIEQAPQSRMSGQLTDFGDPNTSRLATRLQDKNRISHIVQLGDSHTGADFFTGALRVALQQRYGNAGPGWLPPAWIRGQRSAVIKLGVAASKDWQLTSSRLQVHPDFPLGGFVLQPLRGGSSLQLLQYTPDNTIFSWRLLYQSAHNTSVLINGQPVALPASDGWQWSATLSSQLPLELKTLDDSYPWLGGWLVENGRPGVLVSGLGINGATINMLDKWGAGWRGSLAAMQPDLLILAYGSNEAFNDDLVNSDYRASLVRHIQQLRQQLPQSALLIVGAPDVIKHASAETCHLRRPGKLGAVQEIQREVAREQHTLFWDWQAMMGGHCSFEKWQALDLARKDGVHFTKDGYKASADALYRDLEMYLQSMK